jgi:putative hemolysin
MRVMITNELTPSAGASKPFESGGSFAIDFRSPAAGSFRLTASGPKGRSYTARLARSPDEVRAAQALRFQVFNLELKEGLAESFTTGLDADPFDAVCDHLIVKDLDSREVVGTYRLQPGTRAEVKLGYYSSQAFDLASFEHLRGELVELGRACVAPRHRNLTVIQLLWRGIAFYARSINARYLMGCSSLGSADARLGASLYAGLAASHLAPLPFRVQPLKKCACPLEPLADGRVEAPRILTAYLALGAAICGPPAIDRQFGTIDFLTVLDLEHVPARAAGKYLNSLPDFAPALELVV